MKLRACGGPLGGLQRVVDLEPEPRQLLLELRLVVDVGRERVLDPLAERRDDRTLHAVEAVRQVAGAERRLEQRRDDVPVRGQPLEVVAGDDASAPLAQAFAEIELLPTTAQLERLTAFARSWSAAPRAVRERLVEHLRNRELEHAVAEELEPLVRARAIGYERGMRRDALRRSGSGALDELEELRKGGGSQLRAAM